MDGKIKEMIVDAVKHAMGDLHEQRLFRGGKLAGLFPARTGTSAEAAGIALRDGLLEVVRTEVKGKITIDWVRPSPAGVQFVHDHESPLAALLDLRGLLLSNQEGLPHWLEEMRRELQTASNRLAEEAERWSHRLASLNRRVEEALRRAEAGINHSGSGLPEGVPWALPALAYLDRRREGGGTEECPLPELFSALKRQFSDLSIAQFHEGLRRLRDRRALELSPFPGGETAMPQPEYALLDGATVLYFAAR